MPQCQQSDDPPATDAAYTKLKFSLQPELTFQPKLQPAKQLAEFPQQQPAQFAQQHAAEFLQQQLAKPCRGRRGVNQPLFGQ